MAIGESLDVLRVLRSIPCFTRFKPEAKGRLLECAREQSYAKGEIIIIEGEPCPGLFVVISGSVRLYRSSPEGEEQTIRIIRRGGCFECAPVFDMGPNPVSAQALGPSKALLIPTSGFRSMVSTYPEAISGIISILSMRLRFLLNMVEDFSFKRVYARLAKLITQLIEQDGEILVVSPSQQLSQEQIACILGCSRQVVNRSLRRLSKNGIIRMEGRHIIIIDPEALRRIL